MHVPLSSNGSPRGNPSPWELLRPGTSTRAMHPGGGGWGVGDSLPPVPVRGQGWDSWKRWQGRGGVVGVGEIMTGLDLGLNGLGAGSGAQIAMSVPTMTAGVLLAPGVTAAAGSAGGGTLAASLFGAAAVPIIGAAVAGITIALMLVFSRKGPKQKQATTKIVDQVEPLLQENVGAYLSGPRTASSQQQAINNFYAGWQYVLDYCGTPEMGNPGQNCISERQEGAHPQWDACKDLPGGCPNWFQMYLDPIRNDPQVRPDPVAGEAIDGPGTVTTVDANGNVVRVPTSGGVMGGSTGLLLAAAALAVVAFMGDK